MYYIQETAKPNKLKEMLNIIKIEEDKIILPINEEEILKQNKAQKLALKTKKTLDKTNSNKIVISKKIKKQTNYLNYLNSFNIEIVDGKLLFGMLAPNIIDYIIENKKMKKQEITLSICVNQNTNIVYQNIEKLAKEFKSVKIITNHIEKFKNLEKQLYENNGLIIILANNKKKSLATSEIILNIDFPKELLNKYNIYEKAIIINLEGDMQIDKKRFDGLCINDYEIESNKLEYSEERLEKYYLKDLYESRFYKKQNFQIITKKIKEDQIKIKELIGNNGKIIFY